MLTIRQVRAIRRAALAASALAFLAWPPGTAEAGLGLFRRHSSRYSAMRPPYEGTYNAYRVPLPAGPLGETELTPPSGPVLLGGYAGYNYGVGPRLTYIPTSRRSGLVETIFQRRAVPGR